MKLLKKIILINIYLTSFFVNTQNYLVNVYFKRKESKLRKWVYGYTYKLKRGYEK